MDEHAHSEYEILKSNSVSETMTRDDLRQLEALAPADWKDYDGSASVLTDYVNLYDGGQEVDRPEWHRMLKEVGDARRRFAGSAYAAIHQSVDQAAAHLAGERSDLATVLHALEDVKSAIHDGEAAEKLTSVVFKLKELAEFAEKPSIGKAADIVRGKESKDEKLIQEGIANLAQYGVLLELASHGFASVEELNNRVDTAYRNVAEAANQMERYQQQEELAEKWKDYVLPENWLVNG